MRLVGDAHIAFRDKLEGVELMILGLIPELFLTEIALPNLSP